MPLQSPKMAYKTDIILFFSARPEIGVNFYPLILRSARVLYNDSRYMNEKKIIHEYINNARMINVYFF